MKKLLALIITVATLSMGVQQSKAASGEIVFRDAMYGAVVGGLAGTAVYAIDAEDFGRKVGTGVLIGLLIGTAFGFFESSDYFAKAEPPKNIPIDVAFISGEDLKVHPFVKLEILDTQF